MGNPVHRAIWYLRVRRGLYISRKTERYIIDELAEDLFPYGFDDGSDDSVLRHVWWFVDDLSAGKIDISGSFEQRTLERYEALKEAYLELLCKMNRNGTDETEDGWHDDMPF